MMDVGGGFLLAIKYLGSQDIELRIWPTKKCKILIFLKVPITPQKYLW